MKEIYQLPEALQQDLDRFQEETKRFKAGTISAVEYRSFRVPQGVYEQREDGTFMLRVRLPAGGVLPHQLRTLAQVARRYGNGVLHVTTRQDIQVHRVPLDSIHPALVELHAAGLSTKGGGGNTVRNITACYDAGVCAAEAFDVSPYAIALTEHLIADPLSYQLPRKYKIGFSGCPKDCAGATVNDAGFIAKRRGGQQGFSVYVGGGMGAHSRVGDLLEGFVPASECYQVAEAIKRVFDRHGNRKDKHKARLRFLIEKVGLEQFKEWYRTELTRLRQATPPTPDLRELSPPDRSLPHGSVPVDEGFQSWRERNTEAQRQQGYFLVHIPLILGDIEADRMEKLADVATDHGEGMVRTTQWQNLVLRWVHEGELGELYRRLEAINLASDLPQVLRSIIACAGATTCRLGICRSRDLARATISAVTRDGLRLEQFRELNISISGCPNSCGRHPVAQIGLYGAARRVGGRLVPFYVIQLGGRVGEGKTRLAQGNLSIPARNVPAFLREFLDAFQEADEFPDFDAFLASGGEETAGEIAEKHAGTRGIGADETFAFDLGAEVPFSLAGRGPGECSAGVFDLIDTDLASADEALARGKRHAATVLAARALLITQGQEARGDEEALRLFEEFFLERRLVNASFRNLITEARQCVTAAQSDEVFTADRRTVSAFVKAIHALYASMDDSLRFPAHGGSTEEDKETGMVSQAVADRVADLRGVVCPLNYVKVKLILAGMGSGQVLSVHLDEEGARNVPASAESDGHKVLSEQKEGDHWSVLIRKS